MDSDNFFPLALLSQQGVTEEEEDNSLEMWALRRAMERVGGGAIFEFTLWGNPASENQNIILETT